MDNSGGEDFMNWIWSGVDLATLHCCRCHQRIEAAQVLARTFTLQSLNTTKEAPSESFPVVSTSDVVLIYHRHLECLLQAGSYVTISHVWDTEVAQYQYKQDPRSLDARVIAEIVREVPSRVLRGILASTGTPVEVWHDYISVPQWQSELKHHILEAIPRLYSRSFFNVAHLYDIDPDSFQAMRTGSTVQQRCRGISNICNSRWFTRMWTAMELTQSHDVRPMLRDFSIVPPPVEPIALLDPDLEHITELNQISRSVFIGELAHAWAAECKALKNNQEAEKMVGMGNNLVPWQLGPLELIRMQTQSGARITFASAHELIARRCVTFTRDFFYAMLGMVKLPELSVTHISDDIGEGLKQLAKASLEHGDYSPLLMVPPTAQAEIDEAEMKAYGFIDLNTFALGGEVAAPSITDIKVHQHNNTALLTAELVGDVQAVINAPTAWGIDTIGQLAKLLAFTLAATGPSIRPFVETVGARLYAQDPNRIFARLDQENRLEELREKLVALCNTSTSTNTQKIPVVTADTADWIAFAMGLSTLDLHGSMSPLSPLKFLEAHGGTIHLGRNAVVVNLQCPMCQQTFLVRAHPYAASNEEILGATAYRFPGLKYEFTLQGGAGLLVKGGRTVGRVVWATPTCQCEKTRRFELQLEDIMPPRQNRFVYGKGHNVEWVPVAQRKG